MVQWIPSIRQHCPHVPVIVVGLKKDLRDDHPHRKGLVGVAPEETAALAQQTGATASVECSARTREGVERALELAYGAACAKTESVERASCCCVPL